MSSCPGGLLYLKMIAPIMTRSSTTAADDFQRFFSRHAYHTLERPGSCACLLCGQSRPNKRAGADDERRGQGNQRLPSGAEGDVPAATAWASVSHETEDLIAHQRRLYAARATKQREVEETATPTGVKEGPGSGSGSGGGGGGGGWDGWPRRHAGGSTACSRLGTRFRCSVRARSAECRGACTRRHLRPNRRSRAG
ncbi:unnamed protein product [Scytosiphon promiscuus]